MKKLILLKTLIVFAVFTSYAQPFSQSFSNALGASCDHYSIETVPEIPGNPYVYAYAGTLFSGGQTFMHVFTTDVVGNLVWEQYVNIPGLEYARALDVAIDNEFNVAMTGYVDFGGGPQLYAALYDGAGNLISDYVYNGASNSVGNSIYYSSNHGQYVVGGFESQGLTLSGNALLIAFDWSFSYIWSNTYSALCDGFEMAVINDVSEASDEYFVTGNVSASSGAPYYGNSQVLALMIDNTGMLTDNASFMATNSIYNQEALGVSSYYDPNTEQLVLLYNVSNSMTVDENRPYIAIFDVIGSTSLSFVQGFRIEDSFISNPNGFSSNPSFTAFKLIRNIADDTYIIFGMLEAYGQYNDQVLSVYQEFDLSGTLVGAARLWTQSNIPDNYPSGYPDQGGFFSFFDELTLNTKVYTPASTTNSQDTDRFVSILPVPGSGPSNFSFEIMSSTLNTGNNNSICIRKFEMEMIEHDIIQIICIDDAPALGVSGANYFPTTISSNQSPSCDVNNSPAMGEPENEIVSAMVNKLTIYANPAIETLNFTVLETGNYDLVIKNIEGQVLLREQFNNAGGESQVNIAHLSTGIYFLSVIDENDQTLVKRFVKK